MTTRTRFDTWTNAGRFVDRHTGLINSTGESAAVTGEPKQKSAKSGSTRKAFDSMAKRNAIADQVVTEEAAPFKKFAYYKRGKQYLADLFRGGTAVAGTDDSFIPFITSGPVHLSSLDQDFESFYKQVVANAQGASTKSVAGGTTGGAADLVVTVAVPMIGAVVTVGYQEGSQARAGILMSLAWTIGGAAVTYQVRLAPVGRSPTNYSIAQFVALAVSDNAGRAQPALATQLVATLTFASNPGYVGTTTKVTVETLNLRDLA